MIFWGRPVWQDHTREGHRPALPAPLHPVLRSALRHQRDQAGYGRGRTCRAVRPRTILFIDEIHRFNKAQQDAFLPYVEHGTIRLIGATTENPSFEIISALLSRCRVYTLRALSEDEIVTLLTRALNDTERGLGNMKITAEDSALRLLASYSSGDARNALNALEISAKLAEARSEKTITPEIATEALQQTLLYDKQGESTTTLFPPGINLSATPTCKRLTPTSAGG